MSKENIDNTSNYDVKTNYVHVEDGTASTTIIGNTSTFVINTKKTIEKVEFIENEEGNFIEVTSAEEPILNCAITYTFYNSNRCMIKERYGVVNGKIQLIKTINGIENPGYYVLPTFEWEE